MPSEPLKYSVRQLQPGELAALKNKGRDSAKGQHREMSLGEVAVRNLHGENGGGRVALLKAMKKAAEALAVPVCLAIAAERGAGGDGWPTQMEYAKYWKLSDRQAQRDWQIFKRAFPGEDDPHRIARAIVADYELRRRLLQGERGDPAVAFSVPAALVGVG
jgi:hypothetical protein